MQYGGRFGNEFDDYQSLCVFDNDFYSAAKQVKTYGAALSDTLEQYYIILMRISEEGTRSGAAHDAVEAYLTYVQEIVDVPRQLATHFQRMARGFIDELDDADSYLYEKGSDEVVRDYSEWEREMLLDMVKSDEKQSWLGSIWDGVVDFFGGVAEKLGFISTDVISAEEDLLSNQAILMQLNDATKSTINAIFSAVRNVDRKYGRNIGPSAPGGEDYFTSAFSAVWSGLWQFEQTLKQMQEIVSKPGEFTADAIHSKLSASFDEMRSILNEVNEITVSGEVSEKQVQKFASLREAISYFSQYSSIFSDFINDIGGWDAAKIVAYNLFDLADARIRGMFTKEDYEKATIKLNMMSMLEEMWNVPQFSDSAEKEFLDQFKSKLSEYKEECGDLYDWLLEQRVDGKKLFDGRTKEARQFKEFLNSIGDAQKILKYGGEGVELIYRMFTDYSRCANMLESFTNNYEEGTQMYECAKEIQDLYNKKAKAWIKEIYNKAVDTGLKAGAAALVKEIPVVAVLSGIREAIGTIGDFTGEGQKSKAMLDALNYYNIYTESQNAYQNALKKVQNADPNSEGYSALLSDLKNCFEMTKKSMEKAFHAMAEASTGTKKSYYQYCERQAKSAMMAGNTEVVKDGLNIMSYDKYLEYYGK